MFPQASGAYLCHCSYLYTCFSLYAVNSLMRDQLSYFFLNLSFLHSDGHIKMLRNVFKMNDFYRFPRDSTKLKTATISFQIGSSLLPPNQHHFRRLSIVGTLKTIKPFPL